MILVNTTKEIIDSLKKGKMVIIMDDENRENEGDLLIAAEKIKQKLNNYFLLFHKEKKLKDLREL